MDWEQFLNEIDRLFGNLVGDCENCIWKGKDQRICDLCEVISEAIGDIEEG